MLNLTEFAKDLKQRTEWQDTPYPLEFSQYLGMILRGIKRLYIDTGRASEYNPMKFVTLDDESYNYDADFWIDEEEYIMICAQIDFFTKVQTSVNDSFSYTTDALTVANADKPYANLKDTIEKLENERRITHHKMVRFTLGEG